MAALRVDRGAGGCSKARLFPVRRTVGLGRPPFYAGLHVKRMYRGRRADLGIDLRTNRAEALGREAEAPGPGDEENPELDDPVAAAFPE